MADPLLAAPALQQHLFWFNLYASSGVGGPGARYAVYTIAATEVL